MTYLATTLYINKLYQDQRPKIALADGGGFIGDIFTGVQEYFGTLWSKIKADPFSGIMEFMGPALLLKLSCPWMAAAYEIAGALGFNWAGIWKGLEDAVVSIVKELRHPGTPKPTDSELHDKLVQPIEGVIDSNVSDKIDEKKLEEISKSKDVNKVDDGNFLKNLPLPPVKGNIHIYTLIKQGGAASALKSRGILSTLFKKIIPWVLTRALVAAGFAVAGGAARGVLGIKSKPKDEAAVEEEKKEDSKERAPIYNLKLSPTVDQSLYEFNKNDANSVWIEDGNINSIKEILLSWIFSAFPDLEKEKDKLINSSSFIQVENMFRNRNKMAEGLQIYSIPKPFQRKIEIVSFLVNGYLKNKGTNAAA